MHRASWGGKDTKLPCALWAEHPPVQRPLCSVVWKLSKCCPFCFFRRLLYIGMIDYIRDCWWSTQPSALLPCWGGPESAKPVITHLVPLTTRVFQKPQPSSYLISTQKGTYHFGDSKGFRSWGRDQICISFYIWTYEVMWSFVDFIPPTLPTLIPLGKLIFLFQL